MPGVLYREADQSDLPSLAKLRAQSREEEAYWLNHMGGYLSRETHPQQALPPRVIYVAVDADRIIGFIAGHLTQRYECNGELQWIDVIAAYRRKGIASALLQLLVVWFIEQESIHVCVNVAPDNIVARDFYQRHGAEELNEHWLVWKDISVVLEQG